MADNNPTHAGQGQEQQWKENPMNPLEFNKGLGKLETPTSGKIPSDPLKRWNILKEDISLPAAVIHLSKMEHNLAWMQEFVNGYGVKLAPHGKTTMCPQLFHRQLRSGTWAISLATAVQVKLAHSFGISRILMVNQIVGRRNMEIISELMSKNVSTPEKFEFASLVDSAEIIEQLGKFFESKGQVLRVLIEVGIPGGRTGIRTGDQESKIIDALTKWKKSVRLVGVEIFEGVIDNESEIREFLQRAAERLKILRVGEHFGESPILITAAGSAWFDVVAEELTAAFPPSPTSGVEIILRPGCYITHDAKNYRPAQARIMSKNSIAKGIGGGKGLQEAFKLWGYVQSIPEAESAIVTLGKRDAGFDSGFPIPALHFRPGQGQGQVRPAAVPSHWTVVKMMDQHVFLKIRAGDDLRVGDMLGFDIAHPCTNFDRWKMICVMDDDYNVVDVLETYF
jgi:D-serine dehydratase